jgi:hypothetical protein
MKKELEELEKNKKKNHTTQVESVSVEKQTLELSEIKNKEYSLEIRNETSEKVTNDKIKIQSEEKPNSSLDNRCKENKHRHSKTDEKSITNGIYL